MVTLVRARAHPATTLQQEEGVKALEDLNGGLVDGHHDRTSVTRYVLD